MKNFTLAVVGSDQLMRDFLRETLPAIERRFECVADIGSTDEAFGRCRAMSPDLVVFDMNRHSARELCALRHLAEPAMSWALLIIASNVPGFMFDGLIARKACGILSRSNSLEVLGRAAFLVASGGTFFDAALHARLEQQLRSVSAVLSPREQHVLQLIAEGYSTKEVAMLLRLSAKTVDKYRTAVMQKLNVHDVVKLTHCAIRMGLVTLA